MKVTIEIDFEDNAIVEMDEDLIEDLLCLFSRKAKISGESRLFIRGPNDEGHTFTFPDVH